MRDLAFLTILTMIAAGLGLWLLRRFRFAADHPLDMLALALPLGLGSIGISMLALGEVEQLSARGIGFVSSIACFLGIGSLVWWLVGWVRFAKKGCAASDRMDRALAALLLVGLTGTLLTALAPVTDGDALCYHLQIPKRFLAHAGVFYDPDLHETVYPLLTELLYSAALAIRGSVACRLISWLLGVAFALNVSALARPVLGVRAWWAGAVALLVPAVSNGMSAPLNDVALASFGAAAIHGWVRFREKPSFLGASLTGVLTGMAMGVKYPALVLGGLLALGILPRYLQGFALGLQLRLAGFRRDERRSLRSAVLEHGLGEPDQQRRRLIHLASFGFAALLVGAPWYARALVHTGNPVHPFFRHTFGGAGLDEVLGPEKRPLPVDTWHILTALAPLTLDPDRFDSVSHEFGPVFLLFLPALFLERPPRRLLVLVTIGIAFLSLCLTQRQSTRFVLTAVGPLAVGVAWVAAQWWERKSRPGIALVGVLLLVLASQSALATARARHGAKVLLGFESANDYLTRREPTFPVGRWVAANLPASARLVGQDHRAFYLPREYTMELAHRRRTGLGTQGESPVQVVETLRGEGFTHVLFCPPVPETAVEFDPTLGRILAPWLATQAPLYREDLADADGIVRRYAIYALDGARTVAASGGTRR